MRTTGLVWVGKGRQQIHDCAAAAAVRCCNSQIDADAARGVCALESSSCFCGVGLFLSMERNH